MVDIVRGLQGFFYFVWILLGIGLLIVLILAISLLLNLKGTPMSSIISSAMGGAISKGGEGFNQDMMANIDENKAACIKNTIGETRFNEISSKNAEATPEEIQKVQQCMGN